MEKYLKKIKPKYYWVVAFVLTAITYTMAFSYMGLLGNGTYVIARSDLKHQYIPFIEYFCSVLRGEHDYWFSWNLGFGTGTALLFAYYTLSPFNLIYLILGEELAMTATELVIILKAATAAATFQIFIKNYLKKNYYETIIFSMMYALCGFQVCYYFNIMWMDAFYMLPVISLGIIKLLRERKWKLLLFSYAYVFGVNFYMGYIVGMSSFFLFIFAFLYNCRKRSLKENIRIVVVYGSSVVCALLLTAIIWLPAAIQLFQNVNENYPSFSMSEGRIVFILNNFFVGQLQTLRGVTPFIYCGLLSVILLLFFFFNKSVRCKKKVYVGLCLLWFLCLFLVEPLNMMMHAFDKPGFYEQRFGFVFSFVIVAVCCEQILYIRSIKIKGIYIGIAAGLGMYVASHMMYKKYWMEEYSANTWLALVFNLFFIVVLSMVIRQIQTKKWNIMTYRVVLTFVVMLELGCNAAICFGRMDHTPLKQDDYENWREWEKNTYDKIKVEEDATFYRVLTLNRRGQNQAFIYDYMPVENFCSSEHVKVMDALEKLGFYRGIHNLPGTGSTPITRSLLDVAYTVCGTLITGADDYVHLGYEKNGQALAIGYMVKEKIVEYEFADSPFANQDNLLSYMTGEEIHCYERIGMEMDAENGTYIKTEDKTYLVHEKDSDGEAKFTFMAEGDERPLYIYFSQDRYLDVTNGADIPQIITKDASYMFENTLFVPELVPSRIVQIGKNEKGQYSFTIVLPEDLGADYFVKANFCYYDDSEFQRAYEVLKKQQWNISAYSDGHIEGSIEAVEAGIMFTSIPYDAGWRVYVDGKEVEKVPLLENAFIGVALGEGCHEVEMCYEPTGKKEGTMISIVTGIVVLMVLFISLQKENEKSVSGLQK